MIKVKNLSKIIITTLILIICFEYIIYIIGIKSEAYESAIKFINTNPAVVSSVGKLKSIWLPFWGNLSIKYTNSYGYAKYEIDVVGEKGKGVVYLNLEKPTDVWEVVKGNLVLENGTTIPLSQDNN